MAGKEHSINKIKDLKNRFGNLRQPSKRVQQNAGGSPPKLSNLDLTALFRRLDVNGDGALTLQEFRSIVQKLKLWKYSKNIDDYIQEIFEASDFDRTDRATAGASLDLQEFIYAYNMLYNRLIRDSADKAKGINFIDEAENFVRATRYGLHHRNSNSNSMNNNSTGSSSHKSMNTNKNGDNNAGLSAEGRQKNEESDGGSGGGKDDLSYVFEVYTGSMRHITTKTTYDLKSSLSGTFEELDCNTILLGDDFDLDTINRLILADGERNRVSRSNIMWWVDICTAKSRKSEENTFRDAFGIPEETCDQLTYLERDDRMLCFGHGTVSNSRDIPHGEAAVMSIFAQCLRVKNVPLIKMEYDRLKPLGSLGHYLSKRFCHYWPYNYTVSCKEYQKLSTLAERNCSELLESDSDSESDDDEELSRYLHPLAAPEKDTTPVSINSSGNDGTASEFEVSARGGSKKRTSMVGGGTGTIAAAAAATNTNTAPHSRSFITKQMVARSNSSTEETWAGGVSKKSNSMSDVVARGTNAAVTALTHHSTVTATTKSSATTSTASPATASAAAGTEKSPPPRSMAATARPSIILPKTTTATASRSNIPPPIHKTHLPTSPYLSTGQKEVYLLTASDIAKRPTEITSDILSVHIQDQGYGPHALFTYRKLHSDLKDGENEEHKYSFEQHSRAGVLGRITVGVWKKLLEVCVREGVLTIGGELGDSSFALAILLIASVHSVSIESVETLQMWHKHLQRSVEEVATTKHSKHLQILDTMLTDMSAYVQKFDKDLLPLINVFESQGGALELAKRDELERINLILRNAEGSAHGGSAHSMERADGGGDFVPFSRSTAEPMVRPGSMRGRSGSVTSSMSRLRTGSITGNMRYGGDTNYPPYSMKTGGGVFNRTMVSPSMSSSSVPVPPLSQARNDGTTSYNSNAASSVEQSGTPIRGESNGGEGPRKGSSPSPALSSACASAAADSKAEHKAKEEDNEEDNDNVSGISATPYYVPNDDDGSSSAGGGPVFNLGGGGGDGDGGRGGASVVDSTRSIAATASPPPTLTENITVSFDSRNNHNNRISKPRDYGTGTVSIGDEGISGAEGQDNRYNNSNRGMDDNLNQFQYQPSVDDAAAVDSLVYNPTAVRRMSLCSSGGGGGMDFVGMPKSTTSDPYNYNGAATEGMMENTGAEAAFESTTTIAAMAGPIPFMNRVGSVRPLQEIQANMRLQTMDIAIEEPFIDDCHNDSYAEVLKTEYFTEKMEIMQATKELRSVNPYENNTIADHFKIAEPWQALELVKCFAPRNSIVYMPQLHSGLEKIGTKGTSYWKYRLGSVRSKYEHTSQRYKVCLDEKRNYWAFVMSGVAIATFPFSVMTSFFGMNFENMAQPGAVLTNDFWPMFPGDKILWILTIITYGAMALFCLHYEILYGAS